MSPKQAKQGIDWEELDRLLTVDVPGPEWFTAAEYEEKQNCTMRNCQYRLKVAVKAGKLEVIKRSNINYYRIKKV